MKLQWIVEAVNVAGDAAVGVGLGFVGRRDFLGLEGGEEALSDGVVSAVALPAADIA